MVPPNQLVTQYLFSYYLCSILLLIADLIIKRSWCASGQHKGFGSTHDGLGHRQRRVQLNEERERYVPKYLLDVANVETGLWIAVEPFQTDDIDSFETIAGALDIDVTLDR